MRTGCLLAACMLSACSAPTTPSTPPPATVEAAAVRKAGPVRARPNAPAETPPPLTLDSLLPPRLPTPRVDAGDETVTHLLQELLRGLDDAIRFAEDDLAHAAMPGYRASRAEFQLRPGPERTALVVHRRRDWRQGAFVPSEDSLHCAIDGEGFFAFETEVGDIRYSRDGRFRVGADGHLCSSDGHRLSPRIEIPRDAGTLTIDLSGRVVATSTKADEAARLLGQIRLHRFVSSDLLTGDGVWFTPDTANPMTAAPGLSGLGTLVPHHVEQSNTDRIAATSHLLHHAAAKQHVALALERLGLAHDADRDGEALVAAGPLPWSADERATLLAATHDLVDGFVLGLRPGPHLRTGRSLDLAVDGEARLYVLVATGDFRTLLGAALEQDSDDRLRWQTHSILQPEITAPSDTLCIRASADGTVYCWTAGNPHASTQIGRITLCRFQGASAALREPNGTTWNAEGNLLTGDPGEDGFGALHSGEVEVGDAGDQGILRFAVAVTRLLRARATRSTAPDPLPFALDASSEKDLLAEAERDAAIWVEAWSYALSGEPLPEPQTEAERDRRPPFHMGWRDADTIERPELTKRVAAMREVLARRSQRLAIALPRAAAESSGVSRPR